MIPDGIEEIMIAEPIFLIFLGIKNELMDAMIFRNRNIQRLSFARNGVNFITPKSAKIPLNTIIKTQFKLTLIRIADRDINSLLFIREKRVINRFIFSPSFDFVIRCDFFKKGYVFFAVAAFLDITGNNYEVIFVCKIQNPELNLIYATFINEVIF